MARKRMITSDVIGTDKFFSLSLDARGLYMHLNSVADDGFIASPQSTTVMVGGTRELLRELIDAGYIMEMDSGICLVTHWFMHNTLKSDRYNPTIYYADRSQVHLCDKVYCFGEGPDLDSLGNPVEPQKRVGKKKKEKNSLVEESENSPPAFIPTREIADTNVGADFILEIGTHIRFKRRLFEEYLDMNKTLHIGANCGKTQLAIYRSYTFEATKEGACARSIEPK